MMGWMLLIGLVVFFAVLGVRKANENYTVGKGLFKNSDHNLYKDDKVDPSDYDYYNKKDKLK